MQKEIVSFGIQTENGVVKEIGKSIVEFPKIEFNGKGIKWFDDNKLLKPNKK